MRLLAALLGCFLWLGLLANYSDESVSLPTVATQEPSSPTVRPATVTAEPTATTVPPAQPPNRRTGLPEIDAVLELLDAHNTEGLLNLIEFQRRACVAPGGDVGSPPPCEPGEAPGTIVSVFQGASCEGYFVRDPRQLVDRVVMHPVYAVAEMRRRPSPDPNRPVPDYVVVLAERNAGRLLDWRVFLTRGGIVTIWAPCGFIDGPIRYGPDELRLLVGPLTPQ